MNKSVKISSHTLALTNLDKVLYPSGFAKGQVIAYYSRISRIILPHLRNRHLTLKRYPNGTEARFFFEKSCPAHRPPWVKVGPVVTSGGERTIDYCLINDKASLVWVANLAALELHTPLSRYDDPDHATSMVFDLDPGAPADILDCARLGLKLRNTLERLNLRSFAKTSGGKGLHVWIPLNTRPTFDRTKAFANAIATIFSKENPNQVTTIMTKNQRGGKVLIDWSQNDRGKTTVCPYSLRARQSPSVSTPLSWEELEHAVRRKQAQCARLRIGPSPPTRGARW